MHLEPEFLLPIWFTPGIPTVSIPTIGVGTPVQTYLYRLSLLPISLLFFFTSNYPNTYPDWDRITLIEVLPGHQTGFVTTQECTCDLMHPERVSSGHVISIQVSQT